MPSASLVEPRIHVISYPGSINDLVTGKGDMVRGGGPNTAIFH